MTNLSNTSDQNETPADSKNITRREFLKSAVTTSALAGATIAVGTVFRNRHPVPVQKIAPTIPTFDVPNTDGLFGVARGDNAHVITRNALDAIGGIGRFIAKGDNVLIKVNCAFARPSWVAATTSPEVTSEIVTLCYQAGASEVRIADNPISDPKSCFDRSGLSEAITKVGGRVMWPDPSHFRRVHVNDGHIGYWEIFYEPIRWCDKLIGLPTVKTHNLCGASLAMKNWYGFLGGSRNRFHQQIHPVIAELGAFVTPTLVVLDGTRMLVRNGPTGGSADDVRPGRTVAASTDQVAIDAFGAEMLGLDRSDLKFIKLAESAGVGQADYRQLSGFKEVSA